MFFRIMQKIPAFIMLQVFLFLFIQSIYAQNTSEIPKQAQKDSFLHNILLQDTQSILDSSRPLPLQHLEDMQRESHSPSHDTIKNIDSESSSILQQIKPTITTYKQKDSNAQIEDIAYRIHELEKEAYMLRSEILYLEKKKRDWLINTNRSGYYVGLGFGFGFRENAGAQGINFGDMRIDALLKVGYLRYFYNHTGLKAELFHIAGGARPNNTGAGFMYNYFGVRLSFVHDIPMPFKNQYFGFFMGVGAGGYVFGGKEAFHYVSKAQSIGANLHIGASWSFGKHIRVEIERIFVAPLVMNNGGMQTSYEPKYLVSCQWVF